MLPKQVISQEQLLTEGNSPKKIMEMSAGLLIFPTPFKGIYYVPLPQERKAWIIEKPLKALSQALELYLGTREFYFSCSTALEATGAQWSPSGEAHVVNTIRSGKVDLEGRVGRNEAKKTYRAGKIARLLSFYGNRIVFHKVKSMKGCKVRGTPYGDFAMKGQAEKDRKKFHRI